jgi:acetyl-CoA synthetase
LRDEVGYYRITGRVDDVVIVSGHNLGTAPIEDSIVNPAVAESAIVGFPHDKRECALWFRYLKRVQEIRNKENLFKKLINKSQSTSVLCKLDKIQFVSVCQKLG